MLISFYITKLEVDDFGELNVPKFEWHSWPFQEHFISGADDNSIAVYGVQKKKPLYTVYNAHKSDESEEQGISKKEENWISSVAALTNTDLAASGNNHILLCNNDMAITALLMMRTHSRLP